MSRDLAQDRRDAMTIGQAVLPHLGVGWTFESCPEDHYWADLVRTSDGARIRIRVNEWRQEGRVTFRGMWPKFADGTGYIHGKSVSISCDAKRKPESLAKDIARRFLPAYEPEYKNASDYVTRHDQAANEAQGVAGRIAEAIGAEVGPNKSRRGDGVVIYREPDAVRRLVVHPSYGVEGTDHYQPVRVDFEVHNLDPETAAEVLRVIRESEERQALRARIEEPVRIRETEDDLLDAEEIDDLVNEVVGVKRA